MWKGAVADSNVAAQQDGIAGFCAFLKFGGREGCTRFVLLLVGKKTYSDMNIQDAKPYSDAFGRKGFIFNQSGN